MDKLYVCPCCNGQGLVHDLQGDDDQLFECMECESTGRVTRQHRDELLQWQGKCRLRPLERAKERS
jgi:hypothetical protein